MRTAFGAICFKLGIALTVFFWLIIAYVNTHPDHFVTGDMTQVYQVSFIPVIIGGVLALIF